MPWIPFETRSTGLQQQIEAAASSGTPAQSAADLYNQHDLGLLAEAELAAWLERVSAASSAEVAAESAIDQAPQELPEIRESEAFDTRSLRWLRINARTAADKAYAKQLYRQTLFKLWRKHIAATGQTYYPPLRDDLANHSSWMTNQDHN